MNKPSYITLCIVMLTYMPLQLTCQVPTEAVDSTIQPVAIWGVQLYGELGVQGSLSSANSMSGGFSFEFGVTRNRTVFSIRAKTSSAPEKTETNPDEEWRDNTAGIYRTKYYAQSPGASSTEIDFLCGRQIGNGKYILRLAGGLGYSHTWHSETTSYYEVVSEGPNSYWYENRHDYPNVIDDGSGIVVPLLATVNMAVAKSLSLSSTFVVCMGHRAYWSINIGFCVDVPI